MLSGSPLHESELSQLNIPFALARHLESLGIDTLDELSKARFGSIVCADGVTPAALVELAKNLNPDGVDDDDTVTPVDVLKLSTRPRNSLRRAGIESVEELQAWSEMRLLAIPNLGVTSLKEIEERLNEFFLRRQYLTGKEPPVQTAVTKPKQEVTRIGDLLDSLDETFTERELPILVRRFEETLDAISQDFGITRERVRQLENSGKSRLKKVAERHAPAIVDLIIDLTNDRISSSLTITESLPQHELDEEEKNLLPALLSALQAGHPKAFGSTYFDWWTRDQWLLEQFLRTRLDECVPCTSDEILGALNDAPFPDTFPVMEAIEAGKSPILVHPITGDLVRKDARHRDACYLLLSRNKGEPLTVQELAETLEMKPHAISESIRRDDRFVKERPTGLCYLKEWDLSGIQQRFSSTHQAAIHILSLNGAMTAQDLYKEVSEIYPVSQAAVFNVLSHKEIGTTDAGLIDLVKNGAVHKPDTQPPRPESVQPDEKAGTISFEVKVTSELLRGSGLGLSRFVTWWLGLRSAPSERIFRCGESEIRVSRAIHASTLSTMRNQALLLGAETGDSLVVTLDPKNETADVQLKRNHQSLDGKQSP